MAATYTPISSITLGSTISSVTFSSIPQTYTDLIIITRGTSGGGAQMTIRFNGATSTYTTITMSGNGSSTHSGRFTGLSYLQLGYHDYFNSSESNAITHIMNYANTTTAKNVLNRTNNGSLGVGLSVGTWQNTSAITTIEILPLNSTWVSGTTFNLYGILAGNA
jgi:hypothetical protein